MSPQLLRRYVSLTAVGGPAQGARGSGTRRKHTMLSSPKRVAPPEGATWITSESPSTRQEVVFRVASAHCTAQVWVRALPTPKVRPVLYRQVVRRKDRALCRFLIL